MTEYLIENDVYFCYAGSQIVFLDLKRNKYAAIDRRQAAGLVGIVPGWDQGESDTESEKSGSVGKAEQEAVAKGLLERGILTDSPECGKVAKPTSVGRPTEDLLVEYESSTPSITFFHVFRFVKAYLRTLVALRVFSLARIARQMKKHKHEGWEERNDQGITEVRDLILIYVRLRPLFFKSHDKCLLDCLVLVHFLRQYKVYPTWVIGVSTDPFLAHTWLELDGIVMNDRTSRVNTYIPIMAL